jgi:pimeloyl-ACP methyl ester carboxylesterase
MPSFVNVGDRRICYDTWGDPQGLPVFQLHGTPGCRLNRYPDDERLAATGARVITYDRPGYGQSDRHRGRAVVDCVPDVAAIAEDLGVDRFVVTGGSGGGPHCLAVAARMGDRVIRARCVVGIAPYPSEGLDWMAGMDPENVKEFGWALEGEATLARQCRRESEAMLGRLAADPATVLGDFQVSEADRAALSHSITQQVMTEALPETFANGVYGWVDDDLAFTRPWGFDVSEIRVPVEVWYGATDVLVPAAHGRWLGEHVPGAEVTVKTDKGHLGDPDETLSDLAKFVEAARADVAAAG